MLSRFFSIVIMLSMLGAGALEANTSDVVTVNPTATYIGPAGPALGLFVACIIGSIFASLLVVNRIYWRLKLAGGLGYDDWAVIFALVFFFAQTVVIILALFHGYGTDSRFILRQDDNRTFGPGHDQVKTAARFFYLYQIFYKLTINFVKMSVLSLYIRLFTPLWIRIVCLVGLVLTILAMITFTIVTVFQCAPLQCVFNPFFRDEHPETVITEINRLLFWKSNAIWNIASDVIILLLPLFLVHKLKILSVGRRTTMTVMFSFGIVVIVTATFRFTTLDPQKNDLTSGTYTSTLWTQIESALAVSCACLPMVRQLLETCFPALKERQIDRDTWVILGGNHGQGRELDVLPARSERHWFDSPLVEEHIMRM